MATRIVQRDHLAVFKQETSQNVHLLRQLFPMPAELAELFKNEALEKPTQQFFTHFSYYLVCIIDPHKASKITWPLFDSKADKTYRNEFSSFIADYCKKGVISPVMSSYFVNPGCFKVIKLMMQLSNLAVEQTLQSKISKKYKEAQEMFKSRSKDFLDYARNETRMVSDRIKKYQQKKKVLKEASEALKNQMAKNKVIKNKCVLQNLIDDFVKAQGLEGQNKADIEAIKNINQPAEILGHWLQNIDDDITNIETKWDEKMSPFLATAQQCQANAEALIQRYTGQSDKTTYMIEYDPKTNDIETKDLEAQVNSQQKYILKNVIKNERLNFPNLVRGFLVSVCFILKNVEFDYDIQLFNDCLDAHKKNFSDVLKALRIFIETVLNAESKLKPSSAPSLNQSTLPSKDIFVIPALPDLSDLKFSSMENQIHFDSFTPLNISKFQIRKKTNVSTFIKPQARSLITPFHAPRDNFLQSIISSRISSHERPMLNMSQNLSMISQGTNRGNETIASGFTQQQIQRLLSTKKTSSKKHNINTGRSCTNMQRRGLFNESIESTRLFRSYSSPNLFDNREKNNLSRSRARMLSIMQEDSSCSLLEVSGLTPLKFNSRCGTPIEEKENNFNTVNVDVATNRMLLPDLLSPSYSVEKEVSGATNLAELCLEMDSKVQKKPRESLGTALGVDHTILNQFDLLD